MKTPFSRTSVIFLVTSLLNMGLIFAQSKPDSFVKVENQRNQIPDTKYDWAATASVGPLLYFGDLRAYKLWPASSPVSEINAGFGLAVSHDFVPAFGLEANFLGGTISGQKRFHDKSITSGNDWSENNPLYLKGNISEFALTANLNLSQLMAGPKSNPKLDVKIYTGIGVVLYNSKDYYMFSNVQESSASGSALTIPYGIKLNYHLNPNFAIGINLGNRLTTTDNLDARIETGSANDGYGFYAITFSYSFGKPMKTNYSHHKHAAKANTNEAEAERIRKENVAKAAQEQRDNDAREAQTMKDNEAKAEQTKRDAEAAEPQSKQAVEDNAAKTNVIKTNEAISMPLSKNDKRFIKSFVVRFDNNKSAIEGSNLEKLNKLTGIMKAHQDVKLEITGYADNKGSDANNIVIGQKRADAVKDYLVKNGVPNTDRISTVSMGSKKPIATNKTAAGRTLNRRIGLKVTE